MTKGVEEFAKYFINNKYDHPRNSFDGNMKLQKMLYFSQLVHMATKDKKLFNEPMHAFKNGTVIEPIRIKYHNKTNTFVRESQKSEFNFSDEEKETLLLVENIFGPLDAKTLSDLNHQQYSWIQSYERSKDPNTSYHHKERSIIKEITDEDLNKIRQVVSAYINNDSPDEEYEVVNGKTFYYDPSAISLNEEVLNLLQNFTGDEDVYSIYYDEGNGYVIF